MNLSSCVDDVAHADEAGLVAEKIAPGLEQKSFHPRASGVVGDVTDARHVE